MTETTIAMVIAWWVAVYHMLIAGYLIFLSESRTPFLVIVALVKGTLGVAVYLTVRQPLWMDVHAPTLPEIILPITLLLILAFSVLVTRLIWETFDLDPPQQRARELAYCAREWWSEHCHHFGR